MQVSLIKIEGIDAAIISLLMSKRSYTQEKKDRIQHLVRLFTTPEGFADKKALEAPEVKETAQEYIKHLNKLLLYGVIHEHDTLLRFIDLTFVIEGLHRGACDDIDSHSMRMNNRIVRSSTRLAKFDGTEKSEWYNDKILNPTEYLKSEGLLPPIIKHKGEEFLLRPFGYVKSGYEEDNDVLRGNYPLSIISNCIFKINYFDFKHIYKVRGKHSHAHPELKIAVEMMVEQIKQHLPILGDVVDKVYVKGKEPHFTHIHNLEKVDKLYFTLLQSNKCQVDTEATYLQD